MSNNQDIHKKQFYSKPKTTKKINSRLINREDLELIRRFLSNSEEESSKVSKSFEKRIRRNNFKIVCREQIAMLCVHLWHHRQLLARKIQEGRPVFPS